MSLRPSLVLCCALAGGACQSSDGATSVKKVAKAYLKAGISKDQDKIRKYASSESAKATIALLESGKEHEQASHYWGFIVEEPAKCLLDGFDELAPVTLSKEEVNEDFPDGEHWPVVAFAKDCTTPGYDYVAGVLTLGKKGEHWQVLSLGWSMTPEALPGATH